MHYSRIRTMGDPGAPGRMRSTGLSLEEKLRWFGWDEDADGCWLYNGTLSHGYGIVAFNGRPMLAHRASYETWVGEIPEGMVICHSCDKPRCINPAHLFAGTQGENLSDMYGKRRHSHGADRYNSHLTESDVLEARRLRVEGVPVVELAERFGVSKRQMYKIVNGEQWKHLSA